jgi:hypothetical protein
MNIETDNVEAAGIFTIEIIRDGKNGPEVIQRRTAPNLIVNTGKRQIWRQSTGKSTKLFKFLRIGTSAAAAASGQTNVLSPVTGTLRTADDFTLLSGTRTFQWVVSYQSGGATKSAANIREVVLMNQRTSPGGSALSRSTFTAVNKTTADKLKITYRARVT